MKLYPLLLVLILLPAASVLSQKATEDKDTAYTHTITTRAEKIVATLGITDASKAARVTGLIADQYRNLNEVYAARDEKIKAAKAGSGTKEAVAAQVKSFEEATTVQTDALHGAFLSKLSKELSPQQITQVKDGLTYGVVAVTYNGYVDMIPSLTDKQKEQIMAWLVEAREHSMDAESSEKKHAWFGKYKGRINNYLSAAGYDITKERQEWDKRRAAAKTASRN